MEKEVGLLNFTQDESVYWVEANGKKYVCQSGTVPTGGVENAAGVTVATEMWASNAPSENLILVTYQQEESTLISNESGNNFYEYIGPAAPFDIIGTRRSV